MSIPRGAFFVPSNQRINPAMAAASGQYGAILVDGTTVMECTEWSMTKQISEFAYAACSTQGWRARLAGTKEAEGTCSGIFDPADPVHDYFDIGDSVTLKLYYSVSAYFQVPAIVLSIETKVNIEDGEIIRWSMEWGSRGEVTNETGLLAGLLLASGHGITLSNGHGLMG